LEEEYNETIVLVDPLEPSESVNVSFPNWDPQALLSGKSDDVLYIVEAVAQLSGDTDPLNDMLRKTIVVHFFHDIVITEIPLPETIIEEEIFIETFDSEAWPSLGFPIIDNYQPFATWEHFVWGEYHSAPYSTRCRWAEGPQDEWLISRPIDLTKYVGSGTTISLEFWSYVYWGASVGNYRCLVHPTGGVNHDGFEQIWDASDLPPEGGHYWDRPYTLDLSAYSGQVIRIAFQAQCSEGLWFSWLLDDVTLTVQTAKYFPVQNYTFPLLGIIKNSGVFSEDKLTVTAQIFKDESMVYEDSYFVPTIQSGEKVKASFETWEISETGVYFLELNVSFSLDDYPQDNVKRVVVLGIDDDPPVTSCDLTGIIGQDGKFYSDVEVHLSAEDTGSGVNSIYYSVDTGEWLVYTGSFVVAEKGTHELRFYSDDIVGNQEQLKCVNFVIDIDETPPVTTISLVPSSPNGDNGWYRCDVIASLNASDDGAGVAYTKYKIDDSTWETYDQDFLVSTDGIHTVFYYSVDLAGNEEEVNTKEVKIDTEKPTMTFDKIRTGIMEVTFIATVEDNTSGVDRVEFYLDGDLVETVIDGPYEWIWTGTGDHEVKAEVYDEAGNEESSSLSTPCWFNHFLETHPLITFLRNLLNRLRDFHASLFPSFFGSLTY
jgi:hypothetical protein